MTVKIGDELFTSPDTHHVAVWITKTAWLVTWLRDDHRLTRNQAITAMMIASTVGATAPDLKLPAGLGGNELAIVARIAKDPVFAHLNSWAGELGLDGKQAIAMVLQPRKWDPAKFGISETEAGTGELTSQADADA